MLTTSSGLSRKASPNGVTMKVEMLKGTVVNGKPVVAGKTVTVESALGDKLIRQGRATAVSVKKAVKKAVKKVVKGK